jgi:acetolactate synthase I/III small subunit
MPNTTLTVYFHQRIGAFDRIASLLRRRGFPISGITLERTHRQDLGRLTVGISAEESVEQVQRHLEKLPDVAEVTVHSAGDALQREYALLRVHCETEQEGPIRQVLDRHGARSVGVESGDLMVEASGTESAMDALFADLAPFGIEESARTNPIALSYRQAAGEPRAV